MSDGLEPRPPSSLITVEGIMRSTQRIIHSVLLALLLASLAGAQSAIPSPSTVFGFPIGADRQLLDWGQIVSYVTMVDNKSDRVVVEELGKTTLGKPFVLVTISSEETIAHLEKYRAIQKDLAHPWNLDSLAAERLIADGKTVVLVTMNIHSTEIAASQESVELVYELATSNDPAVRSILDNVIVLMIPSLNPDGQHIVTQWYRKTVGTAAEGSAPPELYHHYAGHDNNRDWYMYNLAESRLTARVLYHDWFPEIVYDQHQMGSDGPRLFLPPYEDPVNPNVDPLLTAQVNLLGNYVVAGLQQQGFQGVVTGSVFNAFFEGTMSKTPLWHNRIGILSEMASARIASPLYFPNGSIQGMGRRLPESKAQTNFLDPWQGGWWRLSDIIAYEKAVTYRLLEFAARFKRDVKKNFYDLNTRAIALGKSEGPRAYAIPADQHDVSAALTLVDRLLISGVTVTQTTQPWTVRGRTLSAGSFVVPLAQPARAYVKDLFELQRYPDLLEYPGGPPQRPYDVTGWTLPLAMGVEALSVEEDIDVDTTPVVEVLLSGRAPRLKEGAYLFERRHGASFGMVNDLLSNKIPVYALTDSQNGFARGTFAVPANAVDAAVLQRLARSWRLPILEAEKTVSLQLREIRSARIGIYQPWVTSMDEGWTRLVLDSLHFAFRSIHNEDLRRKNAVLRSQFDVIVLPDMSTSMIVEGRRRSGEDRFSSEEAPVLGTPQRPKSYQGGIGAEGTEALKAFVEAGGTLLAFGEASDFVIEKIRVPAVNVLKNVSSKEFYGPGSLLEVTLDRTHPLTDGMEETAIVYFENSPTFRPLSYNRELSVVASYGDENPLRSGWLMGDERLHGRAAMLEVPLGKGRIVMYGFGVQHRAQMNGTYKLFLNALLVSP